MVMGVISMEIRAGQLGSVMLKHCAAEQDLQAGPPCTTAASTGCASMWDAPGSSQCVGFAQAVL